MRKSCRVTELIPLHVLESTNQTSFSISVKALNLRHACSEVFGISVLSQIPLFPTSRIKVPCAEWICRHCCHSSISLCPHHTWYLGIIVFILCSEYQNNRILNSIYMTDIVYQNDNIVKWRQTKQFWNVYFLVTGCTKKKL